MSDSASPHQAPAAAASRVQDALACLGVHTAPPDGVEDAASWLLGRLTAQVNVLTVNHLETLRQKLEFAEALRTRGGRPLTPFQAMSDGLDYFELFEEIFLQNLRPYGVSPLVINELAGHGIDDMYMLGQQIAAYRAQPEDYRTHHDFQTFLDLPFADDGVNAVPAAFDAWRRDVGLDDERRDAAVPTADTAAETQEAP